MLKIEATTSNCPAAVASFVSLLLLLSLTFYNSVAFAADHYVSVTGSKKGDGSISTPWDLVTALNHPATVQPGDTIWVRGGVYHGRFISRLTGNPDLPIKVSAYGGERVVLDGDYSTALAAAVSESSAYSTSQIKLLETVLLSPGNDLLINRERMRVNTVGANGLVQVSRGWNGSCPEGLCPAHTAGEAVLQLGSVLEIKGAATWFIGLEITSSAGSRVTEISGSHPADITLGGGVNVLASDTRIINCVIYDTSQGIGAWSTAPNSHYYGNLIFNNGWKGPDRGHGHGIYTQNKDGKKLFKHNVVLHQFGVVLQQYGSSQAFLDNFIWEENVFFNGRILFGGGAPVRNLTLRGNLTYNRMVELGYSNPNNNGALIENNFLIGGLNLKLFKDVKVLGNTLWGGPSLRFDAPDNIISDYHFDRNTYYQKSSSYPWVFASIYFSPPESCSYFWWNRKSPGFGYGSCVDTDSSWQERLGYDNNGSYLTGPPEGLRTFLQLNQYDPNLATLVVYNWQKEQAVSVNLDDFLKPGDRFEIRSVIDYFGDVKIESYSAGGSNISMINRSIALARDYPNPLGNNTFPEFGVFRLKRLSGAAPAAPVRLRQISQ